MNLSKKDLKLIYELDSNYRKSYSSIGRNVRMSQQMVSYKVKSLLREGIIIENSPLIEYSRFGYLNFRVYFRVNYSDKERFEEMLARIKKNPNIVMIVDCEGIYDMVLVFASKNPSSFNKSLRELISENPGILKSFMILTTVVEHYFPKNYLTNSPSHEDIVIGGDREIVEIDDIDKKILKALIDGQKSVVEIARYLKVTPKTVMSRMRKMEKKGIIKGYRLRMDSQKMGFVSKKILIKYHNISVEREDELRRFCIRNPNIINFIKTFGEWDLELNVHTRTGEEFRKLYMEVRERFEDIIHDIYNFNFFSVQKRRTIPEEFFAE